MVTGIVGAVLGWGLSVGGAVEAARSVPVIYCTDLFHPHDDPDDHFDLATLYAMPELDIKGVVLDQGRKQLERPGRIPVSQMNKITGRNVPAAIGLADPLNTPNDKALDQPADFLQTIHEHTNNLSQLIDDVLNLSTIEAQRVSYRFEPVAVKEVVERIDAVADAVWHTVKTRFRLK